MFRCLCLFCSSCLLLSFAFLVTRALLPLFLCVFTTYVHVHSITLFKNLNKQWFLPLEIAFLPTLLLCIKDRKLLRNDVFNDNSIRVISRQNAGCKSSDSTRDALVLCLWLQWDTTFEYARYNSLLTCVIAQAHTIAFLYPSPLWVSFLHMLCQDLCSHFSCSRMPKLTPLYGRSVIRSVDKRNFLGSIGYQYKLHMDL